MRDLSVISLTALGGPQTTCDSEAPRPQGLRFPERNKAQFMVLLDLSPKGAGLAKALPVRPLGEARRLETKTPR